MQTSLCTAILFAETSKLPALKSHLARFNLSNVVYRDSRISFEVEGLSFLDVRERLIGGLAGCLDPSRRSCLSFISSTGLCTIVIRGDSVEIA